MDEASSDGDYDAVRLVGSTTGNVDMRDVTTEMRAIAVAIDRDALEVTAIGQAILFAIV